MFPAVGRHDGLHFKVAADSSNAKYALPMNCTRVSVDCSKSGAIIVPDCM